MGSVIRWVYVMLIFVSSFGMGMVYKSFKVIK